MSETQLGKIIGVRWKADCECASDVACQTTLESRVVNLLILAVGLAFIAVQQQQSQCEVAAHNRCKKIRSNMLRHKMYHLLPTVISAQPMRSETSLGSHSSGGFISQVEALAVRSSCVFIVGARLAHETELERVRDKPCLWCFVFYDSNNSNSSAGVKRLQRTNVYVTWRQAWAKPRPRDARWNANIPSTPTDCNCNCALLPFIDVLWWAATGSNNIVSCWQRSAPVRRCDVLSSESDVTCFWCVFSACYLTARESLRVFVFVSTSFLWLDTWNIQHETF